jgi:hypothetical protein
LYEGENTMLFDGLRSSDVDGRRRALADAPYAPTFCLILLMAASALTSLVFACATPFAAFAAVAVSMLRLPAALGVVAAAWVVNQAIGFGMLGYPIDPNTIMWGVAIGAGALLATLAASSVWHLTSIGRPVLLGLSAAAAYATYEIALFAFTPLLGDSGAFAVPVVARLGVLNVVWLIGLCAVAEGWRVLNLHRERLVT